MKIGLVFVLASIVVPVLAQQFLVGCNAVNDTTGRDTIVVGPDIIRPYAISTLSIYSVTETKIYLKWSTTGDDSLTGTAHHYEMRRSQSPITDGTWATDYLVSGLPTPKAVGNLDSMTVTSLSYGTRYYFAIKVYDDASNISAISNVVSATTLTIFASDTVRPAPVVDLSVTATDTNSAALAWTSVGDDSLTSTASSYELRYSNSAFEIANAALNPTFASGVTGWGKYFSSTSRVTDTTYSSGGAMKVSATYEYGAVFDTIPCAYRTDTMIVSSWVYAVLGGEFAQVVTNQAGAVIGGDRNNTIPAATWTQMKDTLVLPGTQTVAYFYIQLNNESTTSTFWVDDANCYLSGLGWDDGAVVSGLPAPKAPLLSESKTVTGLSETTTYWFAIKITDDEDNVSGISNSVRGVTTTAPTPDDPPPTSTITVADKYVSPSGSRSNPGTIESPWDVATANDSMGVRAGLDTVCFLVGTYATPIAPEYSGSTGAPVVFSGYSTDVCSLYTTTTPILISGVDYVIVQNFRAQLALGYSMQVTYMLNTDHSAIMNCYLYGGTTQDLGFSDSYQTWSIENATYGRFIGNYCDRQDPFITIGRSFGEEPNDYRGDGVSVIGDSRFCVIEGNTVVNVSHFAFATADVYEEGFSHNIYRNNRAYNCHGGFGPNGWQDRDLWEANIGYSPGQVADRGGVTTQMTSRRTIFRFNKLYDDSISIAGAYRAPGGNNSATTGSELVNFYQNRIYGNAFMGESRTPSARYSLYLINQSGAFDFGQNVFANNIIAYPNEGYGSVPVFYQNDYGVLNDTLKGNLIWNYAVGADAFEYNGVGSGTLAASIAAFPTLWLDSNIEGSPLWVDSLSLRGSRDFEIDATSPCVDAGVALTTVASNVSASIEVPVGDASWFHYDFGSSPYDQPDSLLLGTSQRVKLDSIDYATNTLFLTDPVTVTAGAAVGVLATWSEQSQTYTTRIVGTKPDIGPYEYGAAVPSTYPAFVTSSGATLMTSDSKTFRVQP